MNHRFRDWWWNKPMTHGLAGHRMYFSQTVGGVENIRCLSCRRDWGIYHPLSDRSGHGRFDAEMLWRASGKQMTMHNVADDPFYLPRSGQVPVDGYLVRTTT